MKEPYILVIKSYFFDLIVNESKLYRQNGMFLLMKLNATFWRFDVFWGILRCL